MVFKNGMAKQMKVSTHEHIFLREIKAFLHQRKDFGLLMLTWEKYTGCPKVGVQYNLFAFDYTVYYIYICLTSVGARNVFYQRRNIPRTCPVHCDTAQQIPVYCHPFH